MARLLDKIDSREKAQIEKKLSEPSVKPKTPVVMQIMPKEAVKDKLISAKVNSGMYKIFTDICRAQGLSNNSALNMLLSDYVREKKYLLEEN